MPKISNIDAIIELILREARHRVKHDISYGLHEVMSEISNRTHDIYLSLIDEGRRKKEDENKNQTEGQEAGQENTD